MKYRYWLAGLCAGLLISCAKESFTVGVEPEDGDRIYADGDEVIRGWIRIKLSEEGPEALRTGQFTRGEAATGDGDIDEVAAALGATEVRRVFRDGGRFAERRRRYGLHLWYDIRFDEEIPVSRAGAEFAALPGVAYAEPVYRIQRLDAAAIPAEALYEPPVPAAEEGQWPFDDPMLSQQWHYYNDGTISGTEAGADMNLFEGWKTTAGSPAVIVAVTDSGVQAANSKRRVWSTVADNDYAAMYGTSMACPHVSGVAALIIAEYGQEGFTAEQCREILLRAYRPVGGLADDDAELGVLGVGLLDAGAAFVTDPQSQPGVVEFGSMQVSGNTVSVPWRVPADGNGNAVAQFVVEYAPKEGGGTPGGGTVANRYDVGQTMVYTFEGLYNTDYEINVRSIDRFGNSSEAVSGSVSIGNFENRPPERTSERMADVSMPDTAETSIVSITLTPYFTDPDLEYGDELSYSATSVNEDIVATEVAGEVLRLIPRAKGTSLVTVTASDLAGATVGFSIYATVAGGTGPSGDDGAVAISPNPVADRLNVRLGDTEGEAVVRIYDGAARLVMEAREEIVGGGVELDVSRLSPGAYSLVAEGGGRTVRGTFVKR